MKSFLQTTEWLEFQKEAGHRVWRFSDGKITANIIKYNLPLGKSYLYIPHGPEIDFEHIRGGIKNELANFIKYLKELARDEKAIFIKMEPLSDMVIELLYRRGFKRSAKQLQPYKTVVLDLSLPEEHLLGKMHTKTRYNIKVAEKHGIEIKLTERKPSNNPESQRTERWSHGHGRMTASQDIDLFWKLMQKTTKRDRFSSHSKEYYGKLIKLDGELKVDLLVAYHKDKAIAGAIVLRYGDIGYYLHGASDYESRAMMAPYALHWDIIKYLKNNGIKYYDFWGIDAKKWPGVTRFKLGWGGDMKENPGSFDLVTSRIWYLAYSLARKVF